MLLFPAIDILNGRAVRLYKGDKNQVTDYGDPLEFAEKWASAGAKWLHVVDLSGAFSGESAIDPVIAEIKKRFKLKVQSGGGLRSIDDIRRRLDAGADRAVIGTMAVYHPDDFALAAYQFPSHAGPEHLRNGAHAQGNGSLRHRLGRHFFDERPRKFAGERRIRRGSRQIPLQRRDRSEGGNQKVRTVNTV